MRPGKGEWGLTEMLRYAKREHGFTFFITDDSVIKGMRRKLKELKESNDNGGWVFPEARAKSIVDNELLGYLEGLSKDEATLDEEARVSELKQLIERRVNEKFEYVDGEVPMIDQQTGAINAVKTRMRTGAYSEMQDQYVEALRSYEEDGDLHAGVVSDQELFFAEMRLMLQYILGRDGVVFDRACFERDYRRLRQAQFESSIENDRPDKAAEEIVVILEKKISTPDAYIFGGAE